MDYSHINNVLNQYPIEDIDNHFIFLFGPYMVMTKGYENICDRLAKTSEIMKYLIWGAYLIRKTENMKVMDCAKEVRTFNAFIEKQYFPSEDIKNKFFDFSRCVLESHQKDTLKKSTENFVTCAAPIVQYEGTSIKKQNIDEAEEEELEENDEFALEHACQLPIEEMEAELKDLLLSDMIIILKNCNCIKGLDFNVIPSINKLIDAIQDKLFRDYYFKAAIYYYMTKDSDDLREYLKLYQGITDTSKVKDYPAFEAIVNEYSNSLGVPSISVNEYDDSDLDNEEQKAIGQLTKSVRHERITYKLDTLNNYIAVNRFMKFEEYPNRLFMGSLDNIKILNIINMGGDRNYYECAIGDDTITPFICCPFLDIRDLKAKVIIYNVEYDKISVNDI